MFMGFVGGFLKFLLLDRFIDSESPLSLVHALCSEVHFLWC